MKIFSAPQFGPITQIGVPVTDISTCSFDQSIRIHLHSLFLFTAQLIGLYQCDVS